jgi:hypothetical protein
VAHAVQREFITKITYIVALQNEGDLSSAFSLPDISNSFLA